MTSISCWAMLLLLLCRPHIKRSKADGRAVRIRAVINRAVDYADGVQADLLVLPVRELHVTGRKPLLPVAAAERAHPAAQPLQMQPQPLTRQASAAEEAV